MRSTEVRHPVNFAIMVTLADIGDLYRSVHERKNRMTSIRTVTDDQIRSADIIATYHTDGVHEHQLRGQESLTPISAPGTAAYKLKVLNIDLDAPESDLLTLMRRIEKLRGLLPREKHELYEQLTAALRV